MKRRLAVHGSSCANKELGLLGFLVGLILLGTLWSAADASAAECTDTWKGSAEAWNETKNWSTGKVPTSSDVACIPAGKSVRVTTAQAVGVVQGEGSLSILAGGALEITNAAEPSVIKTFGEAGGSLNGVATLEVSGSMNTASTAAMSGSGLTVLLSGATATHSFNAELLLEGRRFVNEGTYTLTNGEIVQSKGSEFLNIGTVNSNTTSGVSFAAPSGTATIVNKGTIKKTAGVENFIEPSIVNEGSIIVQSSSLRFTGGGSSSGSSLWETAGGEIKLQGGTYAMKGGELLGTLWLLTPGPTFKLEGMDVSHGVLSVSGGNINVPSGSTTVKRIFIGAAEFTGAGTLRISESLNLSGATFASGTGSVVVLPGATATTSATKPFKITGSRFVNEGTFTQTQGEIIESTGAEFVNTGTFSTNVLSGVPIGTGTGTSTIENTGLFEKIAGTEEAQIWPKFINNGTIKDTTGGLLKIINPVKAASSTTTPSHCHEADPVDCATGNFTETQTDIMIGGRGVGLDLTRSYSAQSAAAANLGIFGYGWNNSFGDKLTAEESGAKQTLTDSSGGTTTFTKSGVTWIPPSWSADLLVGSSESGFTVTLRDQTKEKFNGSGRLESVADQDGNETSLAYNGSGKLETITDPTGRKITLSYNGEGFVEKAKDPMGHEVKYAYESKQLKSVTLPGEASPNWQFKYDASHRMTSMTDGRGGKTTNEYDASNRVITQIDPAERKTTFSYSVFHTKITNKASGAVTDEWFNSNNQPLSITRGFGTASAATTTLGYTAAGLLASKTDGNGHTTTYGYDGEGNRTSERDAEGDETKWTFNAAHQLFTATTPSGEKTTIVRDAHGNPETVSRPAPESKTQTVSYEYGPHGEIESATDPLGNTWTYAYDSHGDLKSETDPEGREQTWTYDEDSRLLSTVSPRGNELGAEPAKFTTSVERDLQGRPLKVTDPLGGVTKYAYDTDGNVESITDPNGHKTKFTYDADNERTKVEQPNGAVQETGYDGAGQVTSQTDGLKHKTTYVRNVLELPIETIDPLERKTIRTFDAAGDLKTRTDPDGRTTTYGYDKANRLKEITYSAEPGQDVSLGYDEDGNLVSMVDGTGTSSYEYDQLGRLVESEDGNGETVSWEYNLGNEPIGLTYPNGKSISREYDDAGLLEKVTDWLGHTTSFGYNADSAQTSTTFPVGTTDTDEYAYDRADRMSAVTMKKGVETLASLSYTRDPAGQLESLLSKGLPGAETESFAYDENERLKEAGGASYGYDAANHLTGAPGTTNTFDKAGQLESATGATFTYDKEGERTKKTPSSGPATTYKYDQAGDLAAIERAEEAETPAIAEALGYDGSGLLASRTVGLGTQHLVWDLAESPESLLSDGEDSYVYGPGGLAFEQISSGEVPTYLHHDQLGSTRALTDGSGETTATFTFSPYGGLAGHTGTATTALGFAGQYTLGQSGVLYLRARYYDPVTGQFLTRDPAVEVTRQPYAYAGNNPLGFFDRTGRACENHSVSIEGFDVGSVIPGGANLACMLLGAEETPQIVDEIVSSPVGGPLFAFGCALNPECGIPEAIFGGLITGTAQNLGESENPCFDFVKSESETVLATLAGAGLGATVDAGLGAAGNSAGLTGTGVRVLHAWGEAGGLLVEIAHAIGGH